MNVIPSNSSEVLKLKDSEASLLNYSMLSTAIAFFESVE